MQKQNHIESSHLIDQWEFASHFFSRRAFPWSIYPTVLTDSFMELSRSHTCSSETIPGTVFAIIAGALGRKFQLGVKESWQEPSIIWHADIRESGSGKTPAIHAIAKPVWKRQRDNLLNQNTTSDEQQQNTARNENNLTLYIVTDLTLEGPREPMAHHLTGGAIVLLNELSSLITAQGQYKGGRGNDRETWLALHDGKPAMVLRGGKSQFIEPCCLSVTGGIQPRVLAEVFGGSSGLFLEDGTVSRFLFTYSPSCYYPLTSESWSEEAQLVWRTLVNSAFDWAESNSPLTALLNQEAQRRFIDWRNQLEAKKQQLPVPLRGILSKAYGYAIRLSGLIHCIHEFHHGNPPASTVGLADLERGIETASFYLAQSVDALKVLLRRSDAPAYEVSERNISLATVLADSTTLADHGYLPVGVLTNIFNNTVSSSMEMTSRGMGAWLRGLDFDLKRKNAAGKRSAFCLELNQKTDAFIKACSQSSLCLQQAEFNYEIDEDIDDPKSAKLALLRK